MTDELKARIIDTVKALIGKAANHFGIEIDDSISIKFNLRGTTAGMHSRRGMFHILRFHPKVLTENTEHYLSQTVPHEVAHYVAFKVYGEGIKPHGREWKSVMERVFGVPSKRCHTYKVEKSRKVRRFVYKCFCREDIVITSVRHNKIMRKGVTYFCNKCGGPINWTGRQAA